MFTQQQQQQQQQDYIICMMHASMRNEATEPKRHEIKYRNANAKISSSLAKKEVKVWSLWEFVKLEFLTTFDHFPPLAVIPLSSYLAILLRKGVVTIPHLL
eukprot:scaffold2684_cov84-Amphora_coffeaeformis.AAC.1